MGLLNSKSTSTKKPPASPSPADVNVSDESGGREPSYKNVLVLHRIGSQYFDQDGDLAHEFYEEMKLPDGQIRMQRITADLRPQGIVSYKYPRLHPDYPYVLV